MNKNWAGFFFFFSFKKEGVETNALYNIAENKGPLPTQKNKKIKIQKLPLNGF